MKLENYEVHLPSYSIGETIYDKIGPVCESYGKTVLVIGGEKALEAAYDKIKAAVDQTNLVIIGKEIFGKDCTYQTVERLRSMKLYQLADMVFGVGGWNTLHRLGSRLARCAVIRCWNTVRKHLRIISRSSVHMMWSRSFWPLLSQRELFRFF